MTFKLYVERAREDIILYIYIYIYILINVIKRKTCVSGTGPFEMLKGPVPEI